MRQARGTLLRMTSAPPLFVTLRRPDEAVEGHPVLGDRDENPALPPVASSTVPGSTSGESPAACAHRLSPTPREPAPLGRFEPGCAPHRAGPLPSAAP